MGIVISAVTSTALIVLFVATVRYQFYTAAQAARRRAPLALTRQYRLFSPKPIRTDIHLVVRDFGPDGVPRPCRELPIIRLRHWTNALWNPWKRRWLPLMTVMTQLTTVSTELEDSRTAVELSTPYLVLLGIISAQPADDVWARQFLLVERFGYQPEHDPVVLFCSAVHRLDRPECSSAEQQAE